MDNCKPKCCRPPKLLKSSAYQPVSNTIAGQTLLYLQMSNHYRRVENAKSVVDSGLNNNATAYRRCNYYDKYYNPPNSSECSSTRRSNLDTASSTRTIDCSLYSPTPSDMALVDQIIYDDKHKPNAFYKDASGMVFSPFSHEQCVKSQATTKTKSATATQPRSKSRSRSPTKSTKMKNPKVPMDIMDHHPKQFAKCKNFQPRILKTTAQSLVHDLKVYHPPRRRPQQHEESHPEDKTWLTDSQILLLDQANNPEKYKVQYKDPWSYAETEIAHTEAEKRPGSKGSSRSCGGDSAYCGGVSSEVGSRGSTPERYPLAKKKSPLKHEQKFKTSPSSAASQDLPSPLAPAGNQKMELEELYFPGKGNQEAACATFLRQITEDILARGIFTDKGINSIFQRHIEENNCGLDQDRMHMEISNLRKQLGIVEDPGSVRFTMNSGASTPNQGTIQNLNINKIQSGSNCTTCYQMQHFEKKLNSPGVEEIITGLKHSVKIDVLDSCRCKIGATNSNMGCGCANTCSEASAFGHFFDIDLFGAGNMFRGMGHTESLNYYTAEQNDGRTYIEMVQDDQRSFDQDGKSPHDEMMDQDKHAFYLEDDKNRSQDDLDPNYPSYDTNKVMPSLFTNEEDEGYPADTDLMLVLNDTDSCGSAHEDSLCLNIKTTSDNEFVLEMMGASASRKGSTMPQVDSEVELKCIVQSPQKSSSSIDIGLNSESNELRAESPGDSNGRTVFFNDSNGFGGSGKLELLSERYNKKEEELPSNGVSFPQTPLKALVSFADKKKTSAADKDVGKAKDTKTGSGRNKENRQRIDTDPSMEKKGCFGSFSKKKKASEPTKTQPLKSAMKGQK